MQNTSRGLVCEDLAYIILLAAQVSFCWECCDSFVSLSRDLLSCDFFFCIILLFCSGGLVGAAQLNTG